ncbi:hypothetical protein GCM10027277_38760 [Pseudoduganella ginsengisoli]
MLHVNDTYVRRSQAFQRTGRSYEADLNTRFTPDSSGNPNLKPEQRASRQLSHKLIKQPYVGPVSMAG